MRLFSRFGFNSQLAAQINIRGKIKINPTALAFYHERTLALLSIKIAIVHRAR
jgi:hypothetical protein